MLELLLHEEYEFDIQGLGQPRIISRHSEVTKSKKYIVAKCKLGMYSAKEIITNFPKTAQKISFPLYISWVNVSKTALTCSFFSFTEKELRENFIFQQRKL